MAPPGDRKSMEKWDPRSLRNPWTDRHQNLHGWLRREPLPLSKLSLQYDYTPSPPNMRQPSAKTPAPIFTINTSNDAVWHKYVPFWGPENKILHFDPIFPPKCKFFANFRRDRKFSFKKALTVEMLVCKLPLIVIVAQ